MRHDPIFQPITAEQFLDMSFPNDRRYELIDGEIRMMTGGTPAHARIALNISSYLRDRLRGSGCRPYNGDMGLRIDDTNLRYPDVSVYCGDPASRERERERAYTDPLVLFEVLSPSTRHEDGRYKLGEYRLIPSVDTIVLIDPEEELCRVVQRLGPTSWRDDLFAGPQDVDLPSLKLVLPHAEIFARD